MCVWMVGIIINNNNNDNNDNNDNDDDDDDDNNGCRGLPPWHQTRQVDLPGAPCHTQPGCCSNLDHSCSVSSSARLAVPYPARSLLILPPRSRQEYPFNDLHVGVNSISSAHLHVHPMRRTCRQVDVIKTITFFRPVATRSLFF